jgi:Flp pilus assembly protein CpaB
MVSRTIQPGQWVTTEDLSANGGISIPEGYQAMSIKVSAESAGSGFILPGSRVNVIATIREQNQKTKVQVILQDQLVLAVDQSATRPDGPQAIATVNTALLAVKPKEAEKLTLAMSLGELRLVLRSPDDKTKTRSDPLTSLNGGDDSGNFGENEKPAGSAPAKELPRVLVAREDVKPGTKVDDPSKFFEAKEWPGLLPDKALTPADLDGLKDKVVKVGVLKNSALSTSHFEGDLALASAAAVKKEKESVQHVLIIQNGGKEPTMTVYKDGQAVENTAQAEPK